MSTDNVTPIRPTGQSEQDASSEAAEEFDMASLLMSSAMRAAILLITEVQEPELAADVLRLARDRWEPAWKAHGGA
jgi:hypothetical protein